LGFAAAENMLYLLAPIAKGQIAAALSTDHIRFLGSTLVHVVSSSAIGFALAFTHGSGAFLRESAAAVGLILAIALHTAFNMLIISPGTSGTWSAFTLTWTVAVIFFAAFEVLKYFQYAKTPNPPSSSL
ncbi:MAG TPA: PrsW family glutamic-type intramembrane protease, partial [Candidatus Paceibacterota bacterium]|nr:PrsW family glutamic-type intramembrane protease [Candidatus Paceibacterota bacterium]